MRVPRSLQEFLSFVGTHSSIWDSNHAALGLSATTTSAYKTQVGTNQTYYDAQVNLQEQAKGATLKQQGATKQTRQMTADIIRAIEVYAAAQADPNAVYALAQIPPPAIPSPAAPPGTPTDFKVGLDDDGSVLLAWKCANPAGTTGTIYEVRRKLAGPGAYVFIGATGVRKFTDDTVISGTGPLTYQVTAVRSTQRGTPASFNVSFGVDGGGVMVSEVTENTTAEKAAA